MQKNENAIYYFKPERLGEDVKVNVVLGVQWLFMSLQLKFLELLIEMDA